MYNYGKPDKAMGPIIKDLKKLPDVSYVILSGVGRGSGDLLVGYRKKNYYYEVKNDEDGKLNENETVFHKNWKGDIKIVWTTEQILKDIKYEVKSSRHRTNSSSNGLQRTKKTISKQSDEETLGK